MAEVRLPDSSPEAFAQQTAVILKIAERYRSEPDLRATLAGDAHRALTGMGLLLPEGVEVRVHANTADTLYLVLPPDPNVELSDEALAAVAGGDSVGSAGTVSTFGSIPGTWGSLGTASSVGSFASAACGP